MNNKVNNGMKKIKVLGKEFEYEVYEKTITTASLLGPVGTLVTNFRDQGVSYSGIQEMVERICKDEVDGFEYEHSFNFYELTDFARIAHECNKTWWAEDWNFGEKIAVIHSELSEALEADRKDLTDDHLTHRKGVEVELADVFIRLGDLCGKLGINIGQVIAEKLIYNSNRQDHKKEVREADGGKKY